MKEVYLESDRVCFHADRDCNDCFVCLLSCMDSDVGLSENCKPIVFRLNWRRVTQSLTQIL